MAQKTLDSMGLEGPSWVPEMDRKGTPDEFFEHLEAHAGSSCVIAGDWRGYGFDIYDAAMRFAEDRYGRMRHEKFGNGMYVIVMSMPFTKDD